MGGNTNGNTNAMPVVNGIRKATAQLIPDLHSPAVDPTGRIDVLAARALRMAVQKSNDPVLNLWYQQFQGVIDTAIHQNLRKLNCAKTLRNLGIAPPKPKRRTARVRQDRDREDY